MDKRTILAIVISLTIWLGWQKFYWAPYQQAQRQWQEHQQSLQEKGAAAATTATTPVMERAQTSLEQGKPGESKAKPGATKAAPAELKVVTLGDRTVTFSNEPNLFRGWVLSGFKTSEEDEAKRHNIDLKYVTGMDSQLKIAFSDVAKSDLANQNFSPSAPPAGALYADRQSNEKFTIQRNVSADTVANTLRLDLEFDFSKTEAPAYIFLDLFGNPKRDHDKPGSILGEFPDKVELAFWNKEGRQSHIADQVKEQFETKAGAYWLGLNTRYFLFAVVPQQQELGDPLGVQFQRSSIGGHDAVDGRLVIPTNGKTQVKIPLRVYFGPKRLETLEEVAPTLRHAIDFGWTSVIAIPLLKMLQKVYSFTSNYGVAIILVTLFVKLLLFPLTYKSMKSMAQLTKLRPQMERLQKKHADDKQKLQQEIWALYKTNGANPLSGCLPLLVQMPVFFALYRVLFNCMELYQAPFAFWIQDLSAKDHFFVTPVLLTGLMFLQQKLTPNTSADPSQQAAMKFMPLMFGAFMLFLPSGLNIYMLVNTVVSIAQQFALNRRFGVHTAATGGDTAGAVPKLT